MSNPRNDEIRLHLREALKAAEMDNMDWLASEMRLLLAALDDEGFDLEEWLPSKQKKHLERLRREYPRAFDDDGLLLPPWAARK